MVTERLHKLNLTSPIQDLTRRVDCVSAGYLDASWLSRAASANSTAWKREAITARIRGWLAGIQKAQGKTVDVCFNLGRSAKTRPTLLDDRTEEAFLMRNATLPLATRKKFLL